MTTRLGRAAKTVVLLGSLVVASRAEASPTARLVYVRGEGAETCPDEEILKQSVAARLGYDPFRAFVKNTLFAEVHRDRGSLVGSVKLVDEAGIERGTRSIEGSGDDCNEIMSTMALSMSIAIDPRSALVPAKPPPDPGASAPEPERREEAPATLVPAPSAGARASGPATALRPPHARAPARLGIGLGLHGTLGMGPVATAGARLAGEVAWPGLSLGIELRGDLPARSSVESGGAVRTWLVGGALVPCWKVDWASLCAVGLLGRVQAETVDVAAPTSEAFAFMAAGLRLAAEFPVGEGFVARFGGDLLGTITPFVLDVNGRRVYRSPDLSGLASATVVKFF